MEMIEITVRVPESVLVNKTSKGWQGEAKVNASPAEMPDNALDYIFVYGLKQALADSASSAKNLDEAQGAMDKKLDAIMSGQVRIASRGRSADEVTNFARQLIIVQLKKETRAAGIVWSKRDPKEIAEAINERLKNEPKWRKSAEAALAAAADDE